MGVGVNVRIKGLDELSRNIARLSRAMKNEALREGLLAMAKPVLEHAVSIVAVDRGVLRDSLDIDEPDVRNIKGSVRVLARQSEGGYHANLIEFGTSKFAAQPFLRPALTRTRGKQRDALIDSVNKTTNKVL